MHLVLCTHEDEIDALHSFPAAVNYNTDPEKSITDFHFRARDYYRFFIPEDVITDPVPDLVLPIFISRGREYYR